MLALLMKVVKETDEIGNGFLFLDSLTKTIRDFHFQLKYNFLSIVEYCISKSGDDNKFLLLYSFLFQYKLSIQIAPKGDEKHNDHFWIIRKSFFQNGIQLLLLKETPMLYNLTSHSIWTKRPFYFHLNVNFLLIT